QPEYYVPALAGGNVNLSIPNLSGYTQFTWLFNSKMKIAELIINDSLTYFENEFKGRTCLHPDGILQIFNVQKEDSSIYILKLKDEKGVEESRKIQLEVFGPVPKPVLKLENIKNSGNYCFLNLSCVVSDPSVSYTWYEKNWHQLEHRHGVLEVTVNQQNYSDSYTCSVSNPVDNKTDTIRFTSFCMQGKKFPQGHRGGP
ncbi:CD48 antigen, partial [Galemys pyrenaicus]